MSDVVNDFFKNVESLRKDLEFFDARVKVAIRENDIVFLTDLHGRKSEIELLKKSTDILLQRLENGSNLRDLRGRKSVDSGYESSAGSAVLAISGSPGTLDLTTSNRELPIQETNCPNPTPIEHVDLSTKDESEEDEAFCSKA